MLFLTLFLILITFIIYKLFIKNPEINFIIKIVDFFQKILNCYTKLYTNNFNRKRFNQIKNFFSKEKLSTNKKFINGVLIEDVLIDSQWINDPYPNKKIPIKIFIPEINNEENEIIDKNKNKNKLPIMVNIHGGGFVLDYND